MEEEDIPYVAWSFIKMHNADGRIVWTAPSSNLKRRLNLTRPKSQQPPYHLRLFVGFLELENRLSSSDYYYIPKYEDMILIKLCRRILTERHGYRIAVIMNEFGDTAVGRVLISYAWQFFNIWFWTSGHRRFVVVILFFRLLKYSITECGKNI